VIGDARRGSPDPAETANTNLTTYTEIIALQASTDIQNKGHAFMAKSTIRPLEDRVVIQQIEAEEKTAGGIVLPDTAKEKPQRGKVLAVGPGKLLDSGERAPIGVTEGDEVLFGKYSGTEIKLDGEEIKILRESDILAKIVK
jgi:chaperonin GroES